MPKCTSTLELQKTIAVFIDDIDYRKRDIQDLIESISDSGSDLLRILDDKSDTDIEYFKSRSCRSESEIKDVINAVDKSEVIEKETTLSEVKCLIHVGRLHDEPELDSEAKLQLPIIEEMVQCEFSICAYVSFDQENSGHNNSGAFYIELKERFVPTLEGTVLVSEVLSHHDCKRWKMQEKTKILIDIYLLRYWLLDE